MRLVKQIGSNKKKIIGKSAVQKNEEKKKIPQFTAQTHLPHYTVQT